MFRLPKRQAGLKVEITNPCQFRWEDMEGGDTIRFCHECKLNVHNLSNMSEEEAREVLNSDAARKCVFICKKSDGTIVTDNCPRILRSARQRVRVGAALALVGLAGFIIAEGALVLPGGLAVACKAAAEALVKFDPRFAQDERIAALTLYAFTVRDTARAATALSFLLALVYPLARYKKTSTRRLLLESIALLAVPVLVKLAGAFIIDNVGNLGGGCAS